MSDGLVHVLPVNDVLEHLELRQCWCRPNVVTFPDRAVIVVHHAADGREHFEGDIRADIVEGTH